MRALDILPDAADAIRAAQTRFQDFVTPTVRLGVTGLARSGKTVFITALVRALTDGARLPFFRAHAEGRIARAYLEPQPDDGVPRFEYETHVAALTGEHPSWPESTRRISQLRVTIDYEPQSPLRRWLGVSRLHVDIVDYPGEWLLDLALLDLRFEAWCAQTLDILRAPHRSARARPFLAFLDALPADADPEPTAIEGARLYRAFLAAERASEEAAATLGPGRFLLPGDLEGSPLLTFCPLAPLPVAGRAPPLHALLARRYESYRAKVVMPFFREHFSRLDRQIVLIDVAGALDRGADAMADLERAMGQVLRAFRPGTATWLALLLGARIDRVLFAATKADHVPQGSHGRLEAILRLAVERASARATVAGAEVSVLALAAVRATREADVVENGQPIPVLVGVPVAGQQIDGRTFDGVAEAGVFPGDLPADPAAAFDPARARADEHAFVRFRPPTTGAGPGGRAAALPHIRLDRAIETLIGDKLV